MKEKNVKNCLCIFSSEEQDFVDSNDWLIKYRLFTVAWCTVGEVTTAPLFNLSRVI